MAEDIHETRQPDSLPEAPEVPKPVEQSSRSDTDDRRHPPETQRSAHQTTQDAAMAELAKARAESTGPRPTPEVTTPTDVSSDRRETSPSTGADVLARDFDLSPETAARLDELRSEGHGPQRHHDPTDTQLAARMGNPVVDPHTHQPALNDKGFFRAENHVDPMTGTTVDGVHGGVHRCGDYATRIDSPEDYVAADRFLRQRIGDDGPAVARAPISEVLGPDAHQRMTGYHHDQSNPGHLKEVDFAGGTIFAAYQALPDGELKLRTMYVDPAPTNPDQTGGTTS